jgi:hypothetical protein
MIRNRVKKQNYLFTHKPYNEEEVYAPKIDILSLP